MPSQMVGRRRWISSSCSAEGVEVPEPAQLTVMPREAAQRAKTCPTGMDAHREGDVRALAAPGAGAVEGARERLQADFDVAEAARVEQRLAGDAARAPVLGDAVVLP